MKEIRIARNAGSFVLEHYAGTVLQQKRVQQ